MALGRGLDALLSDSEKARQIKHERQEQLQVQRPEEAINAGSDPKGIREISIDALKASVYQPRREFDDEGIAELAASISEHGLLEPLIVKESREIPGQYEIICGERRFRACKVAGIERIPCLVRDVLANDAYAIALIENIQREDLNPLELSAALEQMLNECGINQEELAKTLGKSRSTVTNLLRLNKLNSEVKKMLSAGSIDLGHAKVLLGLESELQLKAAEVVIAKDMTVRQTEEFVKQIKDNGGEVIARPKKERDASFADLEKTLSEKFDGMKFKFSGKAAGKGKLTLSYSSEEEFNRLMEIFGVKA